MAILYWDDTGMAEFKLREKLLRDNAVMLRALKGLEAELQMQFDDVPPGVDAWMAIAREAIAQTESKE